MKPVIASPRQFTAETSRNSVSTSVQPFPFQELPPEIQLHVRRFVPTPTLAALSQACTSTFSHSRPELADRQASFEVARLKEMFAPGSSKPKRKLALESGTRYLHSQARIENKKLVMDAIVQAICTHSKGKADNHQGVFTFSRVYDAVNFVLETVKDSNVEERIVLDTAMGWPLLAADKSIRGTTFADMLRILGIQDPPDALRMVEAILITMKMPNFSEIPGALKTLAAMLNLFPLEIRHASIGRMLETCVAIPCGADQIDTFVFILNKSRACKRPDPRLPFDISEELADSLGQSMKVIMQYANEASSNPRKTSEADAKKSFFQRVSTRGEFILEPSYKLKDLFSNVDELSTLARERLLDALSRRNETATPRGIALAELISKGIPDKKS